MLLKPPRASSSSARQGLEQHLQAQAGPSLKQAHNVGQNRGDHPLGKSLSWVFCPCCKTAAPRVTHGSCLQGGILSRLQEGCCLLGRGPLFLAGTGVRGSLGV